jgi:hypothetical protein
MIGTGYVFAKDWVITSAHGVSGPPFFLELPTYVKVNGLWRQAKVVDFSKPHEANLTNASFQPLIIYDYKQKGDFALLKVATDLLPVLTHAEEIPQGGEELKWFQYNCTNQFRGRLKEITKKTIIFADAFAPLGFPPPHFLNQEVVSPPLSINVQRIEAVYLRVDGSLLPGSSGSPILNKEGRVVGMCTIGSAYLKTGFGMSVKDIDDFIKKQLPPVIE